MLLTFMDNNSVDVKVVNHRDGRRSFWNFVIMKARVRPFCNKLAFLLLFILLVDGVGL